MNDPVNNPKHYNSHPTMECIELVERLPFCEGNAIKYLWRAGLKGSAIEDLRKALWYVDRAIQSRDALRYFMNDDLRSLIQRAADGFRGKPQRLAIAYIAHGLHESARNCILDLLKETTEDAAIRSAIMAEEGA